MSWTAVLAQSTFTPWVAFTLQCMPFKGRSHACLAYTQPSTLRTSPRRPLPPHLAAAWQRTRHAQMQLERRLAMLTPDHDLVHVRNSRVFDLVRAFLSVCESAAQLAHRAVPVVEGS